MYIVITKSGRYVADDKPRIPRTCTSIKDAARYSRSQANVVAHRLIQLGKHGTVIPAPVKE